MYIDNPVDIYTSDESLMVMGENGDPTGSPYGYIDETTGVFIAAVDPVVTTQQTATVQQQTASTDTGKKPWYDVIAQLIGAGASGVAAVKAAESGAMYNAATGAYQPYTTNQNDGFKAWGWVILGIILIIVLWVYINSKK